MNEIAAAALLLLALLAPWALSRSVRTHHLAVVLMGWIASVLTGALAFGLLVFSLFWPTPMWQRAGDGSAWASVCLYAVSCVALVLLGAGVASLAASIERQWRRNTAWRDRVETLICQPTTATLQVRGHTVHVVAVDQVSAMSVRLRGRPAVVVGRDFVDQITDSELSAVVEHEQAHLDLGHDRLRWLAAVLHGALPWVPGATAFATRLHLLLEIAADDCAAARTGDRAVVTALARASAGHVSRPAARSVR